MSHNEFLSLEDLLSKSLVETLKRCGTRKTKRTS